MMSEQLIQSRRDFLRSMAHYGGAVALLSFSPWLQTLKAEDMKSQYAASDKVNIGILGTGSRGQYHIEILKQIPHANIVALCDDYEPNLTKAFLQCDKKPTRYSDYLRFIEHKGMDAVIIATPMHLHAVMTVAALQQGLHVLCEKSMATKVEDCMAMTEARRKSGKVLFIGHQRLFCIKYNAGIELIKKGAIGKITHIHAFWHRNNNWRRPLPLDNLERKINWRLYKDYSAGLMTELSSHQIQIANWALNEVPVSVYGSGSINHWNDGREVEDNVSLIYKYPSGTHLVYESVISNKFYGMEEQVMGNKGTIEFENGKYYMETPPSAPGILQLVNDIEHGIFDVIPIGGPSWVPETANENKGKFIVDQHPVPESTILLVENFIQAVRENKQPEGVLEQAFHASVAALLGYQSIQSGNVVHWPANVCF